VVSEAKPFCFARPAESLTPVSDDPRLHKKYFWRNPLPRSKDRGSIWSAPKKRRGFFVVLKNTGGVEENQVPKILEVERGVYEEESEAPTPG